MTYYASKRVAGRHFLQIPGPTNVPDRVLRAIDNPVMDHRSLDFGKLGAKVLEKLPKVFKTELPVVIYPASGTGAWEAALVNTLSPGDTVLMTRTGQFAELWHQMAERLQLVCEFVDTDWRRGADAAEIGAALAADKAHRIKAVCVVHNETSTGCVTHVDQVRKAIDAARHPALLLVDACRRDPCGMGRAGCSACSRPSPGLPAQGWTWGRSGPRSARCHRPRRPWCWIPFPFQPLRTWAWFPIRAFSWVERGLRRRGCRLSWEDPSHTMPWTGTAWTGPALRA